MHAKAGTFTMGELNRSDFYCHARAEALQRCAKPVRKLILYVGNARECVHLANALTHPALNPSGML
jgi:hypothetical protein